MVRPNRRWQELQAEIAAEEEARRLHEELHHKLNLARCAAEQVDLDPARPHDRTICTQVCWGGHTRCVVVLQVNVGHRVLGSGCFGFSIRKPRMQTLEL